MQNSKELGFLESAITLLVSASQGGEIETNNAEIIHRKNVSFCDVLHNMVSGKTLKMEYTGKPTEITPRNELKQHKSS